MNVPLIKVVRESRAGRIIDLRFLDEFTSAELSSAATGIANAATGVLNSGEIRESQLLDAVARILLEVVGARDDALRRRQEG